MPQKIRVGHISFESAMAADYSDAKMVDQKNLSGTYERKYHETYRIAEVTPEQIARRWYGNYHPTGYSTEVSVVNVDEKSGTFTIEASHWHSCD